MNVMMPISLIKFNTFSRPSLNYRVGESVMKSHNRGNHRG